MGGSARDALRSLGDVVRLVEKDRPHDVVGLALLQAELLHLDLLHGEALAVMDKVVIRHLDSLTPAERFSVEQNRSDLQFYLQGDTAHFYNIVDQKRLLDFEWLDYRDLFSAKQDADSGKHFETLSVLWQQHRRAYLHGCWLAQRWTNSLLARECIHLKEWEDAVHHAILARDDALFADIADGILSSRRAELVKRVVSRLIRTANLRTHFVCACKLLRPLADAIPDASIQPVGEWLLNRAREEGDICLSAAHFSTAWETIGAVGMRFSRKLAQDTIAVAIDHPVWKAKYDEPNRFSRGRKEMVRAMVPITAVITTEDIQGLASAALPLLTDRPQIPDYDDVVNLLCRLADRGGLGIRDSLAASLYPDGQPVSRMLAQVADVFGKEEMFDAARLQKLADQVDREIQLQVQWLEPGQSAEPVVEQIMEFSTSKSDRTLKVYLVSLVGLHSLARHRAKLDEQTIEKVVMAILDMARNKDNYCVNRSSLLRALVVFADAVPARTRTAAIAALEPLARGQVEESSEYSTAAETDNPLNPYKTHTGRPEDVQGMALGALAALVSGDALTTKRVENIFEEALCDHRPAVRRAAYAAARRLSNVSEGVILGVLTGLRDPDPNASMSAFATLAEPTGWRLHRNHWRVFLMAARLAQRTGNPNLRRQAARALVALSPQCPPHLRGEHAALLTELSDDICWSVRTMVRAEKGDIQDI